MSDSRHWQLKIFQKTLKKKEKLNILNNLLPPLDDQWVLDLGCAKGTLSYFLRQSGGRWVSADLDQSNLDATVNLVQDGVIRVGAPELPFKTHAFDGVVSLDFIEHIHQDSELIDELFRVIRPGGWLILSTPITGRFFILNRVKRWVGLPPEAYGHVVEGYTLDALDAMLKRAGFDVTLQSTYSRFFTELIELAINVAFVKILNRKGRRRRARDGHISPGSADELKKHQRAFNLYSFIYPITWLITRLDHLLFFIKGYATLLRARRP